MLNFNGKRRGLLAALNTRRRLVYVSLGVVALIALGAGVVLAATATTISSCVTDMTGSVRITADPTGYTNPKPCVAGEHALAWNQTGPQGPPGTGGSPDPSALRLLTIAGFKGTDTRGSGWHTLLTIKSPAGARIPRGALLLANEDGTIHNPATRPVSVAFRVLLDQKAMGVDPPPWPFMTVQPAGYVIDAFTARTLDIPPASAHTIRLQARVIGPFSSKNPTARVRIGGSLRLETASPQWRS